VWNLLVGRRFASIYWILCKYKINLLYILFWLLFIYGDQVRFIIMGNLFCSEHRIHRRFDLKGSSHGRTTDKAEGEIDETTTLKDLDLNFVFRLQRSWFLELLRYFTFYSYMLISQWHALFGLLNFVCLLVSDATYVQSGRLTEIASFWKQKGSWTIVYWWDFTSVMIFRLLRWGFLPQVS